MIFQIVDKRKSTVEWVNPCRVRQNKYVHIARNPMELLERNGKDVLEFYLTNNQVIQAHVNDVKVLVETMQGVSKYLQNPDERENGFFIIRADAITEREYYQG